VLRQEVAVLRRQSPLSALTTALLQAAQGTSYSQALKAGGGVPGYAWSIATGALPTGLHLASNGTISGTPTVSGTFTLTFNVADHSMPAPQSATSPSLTLVVNPPS
jgi:Putative Ig domain